jgi:hypothetical protein|tara:strand:- start:711 stop:1133 length:423 start_codon:yes stop_codon:yes gene_type:complete
MAALSEIRDGIKTTISGISGIRCYDVIPDNAINFPVAIILPQEIQFDQAMQRGTDRYTFTVLVAVQRADARTAQDKLDEYITGAGSNSVRQAIFNNRTLGLSDTDARVMSVSNYAADVNLNGIDGVGANLEVEVYTKGSS